MKVLVTGATGFIGHHVIENLLTKGVEVVAVSTDVNKARGRNWFSKVHHVSYKIGVDPVNSSLFEDFGKPDVAIHLAWQGLPNYKGLFHFEEILFPQYFFLKQLIETGLKDLTVSGTCFEYGMKSGCLEEGMSTAPSNPYGLAKDTLRKFLELFQNTHPFSLKWVRLFYIYGEGQNPKSLFAQLSAALNRGDAVFNMSGGRQVRDYLPVEAVAANLVNISLQKDITGLINCCSGIPVTVREMVENFVKKSGKQIQLNLGYYPYPDYEPMEFWGSTEKLQKIKF